MRDYIGIVICIIVAVIISACNLSYVHNLDYKNKLLEKEKKILIDNYLSNIHKYRTPLFRNKEQKLRFIDKIEKMAKEMK